MNKKILGLDVGEKIIGCALADFHGIVIDPLEPIIRKGNSLCLPTLKYLIKKNQVTLIIIGNPLSATGKASLQSKKVKSFANKLKRHLQRFTIKNKKIEITLVHEGLTTWVSKANFPQLKLKKKKEVISLDSFAAREILLNYFNEKSH